MSWSSMGSWEFLSKLPDVTQCSQSRFQSSLDVESLEVIATGDQMKHTVTSSQCMHQPPHLQVRHGPLQYWANSELQIKRNPDIKIITERFSVQVWVYNCHQDMFTFVLIFLDNVFTWRVFGSDCLIWRWRDDGGVTGDEAGEPETAIQQWVSTICKCESSCDGWTGRGVYWGNYRNYRMYLMRHVLAVFLRKKGYFKSKHVLSKS